MVKPLGRLEKVDIRVIWEPKALEFTPWLAKHLTQLGEELLVDFDDEDVDTEVSVPHLHHCQVDVHSRLSSVVRYMGEVLRFGCQARCFPRRCLMGDQSRRDRAGAERGTSQIAVHRFRSSR